LLGEKAYKQQNKPPTSLGLVQQEWCLDERKISRIISAVATKWKLLILNIRSSLYG
jgi:hypothetical protein